VSEEKTNVNIELVLVARSNPYFPSCMFPSRRQPATANKVKQQERSKALVVVSMFPSRSLVTHSANNRRIEPGLNIVAGTCDDGKVRDDYSLMISYIVFVAAAPLGMGQAGNTA
jgi:hypothetical protein